MSPGQPLEIFLPGLLLELPFGHCREDGVHEPLYPWFVGLVHGEVHRRLVDAEVGLFALVLGLPEELSSCRVHLVRGFYLERRVRREAVSVPVEQAYIKDRIGVEEGRYLVRLLASEPVLLPCSRPLDILKGDCLVTECGELLGGHPPEEIAYLVGFGDCRAFPYEREHHDPVGRELGQIRRYGMLYRRPAARNRDGYEYCEEEFFHSCESPADGRMIICPAPSTTV